MTTIPPAPLDPEQVALALAPFGESRLLPRDAYVSDDVLEWERRYLFDDWMCVGRSSDVPATGLRAESVGGYGVLLVRDKDGELRAFENVCRHRGHELLPCGGSAQAPKAIVCPYHAWSYRHDGSLIGAPNFKNIDEHYDRSTLGLVAGAGDGVARLDLHRPHRHGRGLRRAHRWVRGGRRAVRRRLAGDRREPHLRRGGQLEGHHRELPGVLPLLDDPPRAVPDLAADQRRQRAGAHRQLGRRLDGPARGHGDHVARRPQRRREDGAPRRARAVARHVRRRPAQPADLAAPRLRDDPPAGADLTGADADHLLVGLPAARRRGARASARRTPWTSGTSPTARTGPPASRSSAAWSRRRYVAGPLAPDETGVYDFTSTLARAYQGR